MGEKRKHDSDEDKGIKQQHNTWREEKRQKKVKVPYAAQIAALDAHHPNEVPYVHVPAYDGISNPLPQPLADIAALPAIQAGYLSEAPFTHASTIDSKYSSANHLSYERLEFLGDAYIEIIATRIIFSRFPHLLTGKQAQLREKMVRNTTLAEFAQRYGFDKKIKVTEVVAAGKVWEKILADVFEAYVAALILSNPKEGFATAESWLTCLWIDILTKEGTKKALTVDHKTRLAQKLCSKGTILEYREERPMKYSEDKGTQRHFIGVYLTGWGQENKRLGGAEGVGKKEAGMLAALDAMENNTALVEEIAEEKRTFDAKRKAALEAQRAAEA